jgi:hypothetical protein
MCKPSLHKQKSVNVGYEPVNEEAAGNFTLPIAFSVRYSINDVRLPPQSRDRLRHNISLRTLHVSFPEVLSEKNLNIKSTENDCL